MEACTTVNRNIEVLLKKYSAKGFMNNTNAFICNHWKKTYSFFRIRGVTGCPLYSRPCLRFRFPQIRMGNIHIVAKLKISYYLKKTNIIIIIRPDQ